MARSNGPLTPSGAGRTPRPDPQNWAQGTPQQRQQAPRASQSAGAAYQQAAYGGQQPVADPRYARPQAEQRPAAVQPQRAGSTSNAFDAFVSQQAPSPAYETTGGRQAGHQQQTPYGGQQPADQSGFGQWPNATPAADARGFDYGGYGAPAAGKPAGGNYPAANVYGAQGGYGQPANYDQPQNGADNGYYTQEDWGQQADGYNQEPSLDPSYGQHGYGHEQAGTIEQSYAEDDEYEDEPRGRRKLPLIAAAVVGAVLCGGGLAYGYKTFLGPVASMNTPLIKTSSIPSKVKPDDPGGRKFAHSDQSVMGGNSANKIMGEPLTDGGAGPTGEGARKVQTVEVRPDGSVVPQAGGNSPRPSPTNASAMDFPAAGDTGGSPDNAAASAPAPQVIAKADPTPAPSQAAASDPVADEAPAAAPPKKVLAKKVLPSAAPEGSIGPAPTGAGWVAVLASVPVSSSSQMDSLKQFADMQQKYGDVLGDKTPSVQEANLGEKGRYHRLVVGPPASRDSASSICGSLKTAGYSGCWVMQY